MNNIRLPQFRMLHAAYVTTDLELGMRRLTAMFGAGELTVYPEMPIPTPGGDALITFALGKVNGFPMEVIEPRGGNDGLYRHNLPKDPADIQFHHYASAIKSEWEWQMLMEAIDKHRFDTPVRGHNAERSMKWVYLDAREHLGHMMEFIWQYEGEFSM